MPSITGIELGPDSCVLVRARPLPDAAEISALHLIERAEWPQHDLAQTTTLREIRRRKRLPRRTHVVAWGLTEPALPSDPHVRSLLKPLIAAGFRVEKVLTPPEALAALARTRPRRPGTAVAWLGLNVYGVAIAIVRDGELLFSRTFEWTYTSGAVATRAELLQRYSLVSHLAPEVRRGITMARSAHGATVDTVITCGDLPELRSLTMPLIEELDLEVETLDSTEGLLSVATARNDRFAESAPALRLAVAAALSGAPRGRRRSMGTPQFLKPAAAAALVMGLTWVGQQYWFGSRVRPVAERVAPATSAAAPVTVRTNTGPPPSSVVTPSTVQPAPGPLAPREPVVPPATSLPPPQSSTGRATTPSTPGVAGTSAPLSAAVSDGPKASASSPRSPVTVPNATPNQTPVLPRNDTRRDTAPPSVPPPLQKPAATGQKPLTPAPPVVAQQKPVATDQKPVASAPPAAAQQKPVAAESKPLIPAPPAGQQPKPSAVQEPARPVPEPRSLIPDAPRVIAEPPRSAEPPRAEPDAAVRQTFTPRTKPPVPLKEAVPPVESILISKDRRVAIVGGAIVAVGDSVGSRVVSQIERDSVVLREPSGYEIRVRLRQGPGTAHVP